MVELKISNNKYLTHDDLEIYLNAYELYYRKSYEEGLMQFEWKNLIEKHNLSIEKTISSYDKIELIVSDVVKINDFNPNLYSLPVKGDDENPNFKWFRGEPLGLWERKYSYLGNPAFEIQFKEIKILNPKKPPFFRNEVFGHKNKFSVPNVTFSKIVKEIPLGIKKGEKHLFNINYVRIGQVLDKQMTPEEIIEIKYFEKNNIFPTESVSENQSASNGLWGKISDFIFE